MSDRTKLRRVVTRAGLCTIAAVGAHRTQATDLWVKYSLAGDSNLDGKVDTQDFTSLTSNLGNSSTLLGGDFNYDGVVNLSDFILTSGSFNTNSNYTYHSTLYTDVTVRFDNHRKDDQVLNIDSSWLPHVLAAQQQEAGIKLNTEALKALAVADRSLLYYTLDAKGWISSGKGAPDCDLSLAPTRNMKTAAAFTEREVLQFDHAPLIGYAVNGDKSTQKFVTDNTGLSGNTVSASTIGNTETDANRGCLSIAGAESLAANGANYLDILKQYYGDDAQLTIGTYKFIHATTSTLGGLIVPPASSHSTTPPPAPAQLKMLENFEHDDAFLGADSIKHVSQTNVTTATIQSVNKGLDSGTSELITINYDTKHAKSQPFTFRAMTGNGPNEKGTQLGDMILPADGELGFMIRTKTTGLSTQILVNDEDGSVGKSAARDIIADGHWHLYSWEIDSPRGWKNFATGKNHEVGGLFTLNSILLNGKSNAQLSVDDIVYQEYPNNGTITHLSYEGPSTFGSAAGSSGVVTINNGSGFGQFSSGTVSLPGGGAEIGTIVTIGNTGGTSKGSGTLSVVGAGLQLGGGAVAIGNTGTFSIDNLNIGTVDTGIVKVGAGSLSLISNPSLIAGNTAINIASLDISNSPQLVTLLPSGIPGTVLVPEPMALLVVAFASILVHRRRRAHSSRQSRKAIERRDRR